MNTALRLLASVLAVVAAGGAPRPAMALSCAMPGILAPRADQTNVPIDTRLWFAYRVGDDPVAIKLVGPEGDVPLEIRRVAVTGVPFEALMATPARMLAPSTSYLFEVTCGQQPCGTANRFTTGTARAPAPALPVVRKQQPFSLELPGVVDRAVRFEFEPQDLLVVVDVAGASPFRADAPESALAGGWGVKEVWVGDKVCNVPEARFPLDRHGQSTHTAAVRFGRVDLAGNFSGWTEPRSVTLPPVAGGCSVGGPSGGGLPFLLVALVGLLRRRR